VPYCALNEDARGGMIFRMFKRVGIFYFLNENIKNTAAMRMMFLLNNIIILI